MTFSIIKRETCPVVKWKNGAGWTTNLLAYPANAGLEDFDWRVSLAQLDAKCSYSLFSGVDRIQLLLSGRGLAIYSAGHEVKLIAGQSYRFSGDEQIDVEPDGDCEALNIMVRRLQYQASYEIYQADFNTQLNDADFVCYMAEGECSVCLPDGSFSRLLKGDCLHIRHDGYMLQTTAAANAVIVAIRFSRVQEHHAS